MNMFVNRRRLKQCHWHFEWAADVSISCQRDTTTVEVEMFALKNVCDFSNPANMTFFANRNYLRFSILFESL